MTARIGISTGKEWVVEGTADEVVSKMIGDDPFAAVDDSDGRRVYIFRAHVAYVEEEMPTRGGPFYEEQGGGGSAAEARRWIT